MSVVERALDSVPVMLDDTVLRDIREQLGVAGVLNYASFVLVELCERGLMAAVVDATTGVRLVEHADTELRPPTLDLAIAHHLVRTGRVGRPESSEWAAELLDLVTELRGKLATADGAFAMGADHVGLLRVSRRDVVATLHPHLMAAQALWQSAALGSEVPVGALVFMPDHVQWPGLFSTLSQHAPLPAIALRDATAIPTPGPARHGAPAADISEQVVVEPVSHDPRPPEVVGAAVVEAVVVEPVAEPESVVVEREPLVAEAEPKPEVVEAASVEPTPVFASAAVAVHQQALAPLPPVPLPPVPLPPVAVPTPVLAPTPVPAAAPVSAPQPAPNPPAPVISGAPIGTRTHSTREQDVYFESLAERGPISVHDHRDVRNTGGPRHYSPPVLVAGTTSSEARRVHNRRLLIGAGAVASSAAVGVIVLTLPWIDRGNPVDSRQVIAAQTSQPTESAGPTQPPTPSRTPIDTAAARAPATQYTAPPAEPTAAAAPPQTTPRRTTPAPRPRPRPRSIPNPIPGLPPILLP